MAVWTVERLTGPGSRLVLIPPSPYFFRHFISSRSRLSSPSLLFELLSVQASVLSSLAPSCLITLLEYHSASAVQSCNAITCSRKLPDFQTLKTVATMAMLTDSESIWSLLTSRCT